MNTSDILAMLDRAIHTVTGEPRYVIATLPILIELHRALNTCDDDYLHELIGIVISCCVLNLCLLEMGGGDLESKIDLNEWPDDKLEMLQRKQWSRFMEAFADAAIAAGHSLESVLGIVRRLNAGEQAVLRQLFAREPNGKTGKFLRSAVKPRAEQRS